MPGCDDLELGELRRAARDALAALLARDDPSIVGIVLSGSAGLSMATEYSDVDVIVVRAGEDRGREIERSAELDEIPMTLPELEQVAAYDSPGWGYRWALAYAPVLRDRTGGRVVEAVRRHGRVSDEEARHILLECGRLDGMINLAYRALKSDRDGRAWEARLDCAEAIPWLLDVVFTVHGRVRPYNKFLAWELREHPLDGEDWHADLLLARLAGLLDGSPAALRELFGAVEHACRAWDERTGSHALGDVIDGWEEPVLALLRGR